MSSMSGGDITACQEHAARLGLMACLSKPLEFRNALEPLADMLELDNQASSSQPAAFHNLQKGRLGRRVKKTFGHRRSRARYA